MKLENMKYFTKSACVALFFGLAVASCSNETENINRRDISEGDKKEHSYDYLDQATVNIHTSGLESVIIKDGKTEDLRQYVVSNDTIFAKYINTEEGSDEYRVSTATYVDGENIQSHTNNMDGEDCVSQDLSENDIEELDEDLEIAMTAIEEANRNYIYEFEKKIVQINIEIAKLEEAKRKIKEEEERLKIVGECIAYDDSMKIAVWQEQQARQRD